MGTAADVLRIAAGEIGTTRNSDGTSKYGRWYADTIAHNWGYASGAWCAMFVSWVFDQAGVKASGLPGAYCPYIRRAGFDEGTGVDWLAGDFQPGDIVLFNWAGDIGSPTSNHVGIVEYNRGAYRDASGTFHGHIQTIEGNTSNGIVSSAVARRTRSLSVVNGAIRPFYSAAPMPAPGQLEVDGWIGRKTVYAWGEQMRCDHTDVIRDQDPQNVRRMPNVVAVTWGQGDGDWLIHAVQQRVGTQQDGHLGPVTIKAMQRFLGVGADGIIGPATASALQRSINEGRWQ